MVGNGSIEVIILKLEIVLYKKRINYLTKILRERGKGAQTTANSSPQKRDVMTIIIIIITYLLEYIIKLILCCGQCMILLNAAPRWSTHTNRIT